MAVSVLPAVAAAPATKPRPAARRTGKAAHGNTLASLVGAYRESPTPARRAAIEAYASRNPKDAPLARLGLGVAAYQQKDFQTAIAALNRVQGKLAQISDYTAYFLASARVETKDTGGVGKSLSATHGGEVPSPLSGRAWLLAARALQGGAPGEAVRLLRDHYAELPQPEGDLILADCHQAASDLPHAAEFYQRVYYQYISGDAAGRAAAALTALKNTMGTAYPRPLPQQTLQRADRLLDARQYTEARSEYQSVAAQQSGVERDLARVRMGEADYLGGDAVAASRYLQELDLPESEADAERWYYLAECARRSKDDGGMMAAVKRLGEKYPKSPWRLKALLSAANRYLLVNADQDYIPLYQAAYDSFPAEPPAGLCHWKVTFSAYLRGKAGAADLLKEHLRLFPGHATAGAALYFLGRRWEQDGYPGAARACYERLSKSFQNSYYAGQARLRLARPEVAGAAPSPATVQFLAGLVLPRPKPVPAQSTRATAVRIERSRLLRAAGLGDLADSELRFGARTDGQPALLAMEMAAAAEATHHSVRIMKAMAPEYLSLPLADAPRRFWELLFPLPYRGELVRSARAKGLDPYLVAGLIRQESEFNPQAVSRASAVGLTQVRPGTGRQFAHKAGVRPYSSRMLMQPAANLKIGTSILRSMLDRNGGNIEQTLASYNAGPDRVSAWLAWNNYREPAEFVESIPFTETRDYVQAVLRNAEMYRRLYEGQPVGEKAATAGKPARKPAPRRKGAG